MLAPFLMIGVGGSGGKTLRAVRLELEGRLREVGWTGDFPSCWQLVHIDVPTAQDGIEEISTTLPARDYLGLVSRDITYRDVDDMLRPRTSGIEGLEAVGGWRPDQSRVRVNISTGAGQFRSLGRMVALAYAPKIREFISDVAKRLSTADIPPELLALGRKFGADLRGNVPAPVAIVISSIAGGTGAGMALDVCELLRSIGDVWAGEAIGFFYTPDVFNSLSPAGRAGVNANALATLMETLSTYWAQGYESSVERQLLQVPADQQRRGSAFPILVGAQNTGGVQFTDQHEVYRAAAKALSALLVSEGLQDNVVAHIKTNIWPQSATFADTTPLKGGPAGGALLPFGGIGFARVSLGRDLFAQYSKERLSRQCVERLLREHLRAAPKEDRTNPDQAVKVIVDQQFPRFLDAVGLNVQRDAGQQVLRVNQVIDALRPPAEVKAAAARAVSEIDEMTSQHAGERAPGQWLNDIVARVRNGRDGWMNEQRRSRDEHLRTWADEIQRHLAETVAWYAGAFGLRVAEGLLVKLSAHLQAAARLIEEEGAAYSAWAAQTPGTAQRELPTTGAITARHSGVVKSTQKLVQGVFFEVDAETRALAARVLDDMRENLVGPLAAAVGDSRVGLESEENAADAAIKLWPQGDDVPSQLSPGQTEFLVESTDTYPRRFLELVRETAGDGSAEQGHRTAIRQVVAFGTPRRPVVSEPLAWSARHDPASAIVEPQRMIEFEMPWEPRELGIGERARPSVHCRASDLMARADSWLYETQFPFERFLREDLQRYIESDELLENQRREREVAFNEAFLKAARAASPLIGIDAPALSRAHGEQVDPQYRFSRIPFNRTSSVGNFVAETLVANGFLKGGNAEETLSRMLGADGPPVHHVDIFSVLSQPYHAVVFESITKPIREEWNSKKQGDGVALKRQAFWQWRRTRSLGESIPATPSAVDAMTRGWFTAALLGQTKVEAFDDPDRLRVSIYVPASRAFVDFPTPLLEYDHSDRRSLVPGLLLNLGVAIVSYAEAPEVFQSYHRLVELGGSNSLSPELISFISSGSVAVGAPAISGAGATEGERLNGLVEKLEKSLVNYARLNEQEPRLDTDVTPQWEFRKRLVTAHETLLGWLANLEQSGDTL